MFIPTNVTAMVEVVETASSRFLGIACSDAYKRASNLDELQPAIAANYRGSRLLGDYFNPNQFACAQWKFDAKERYGGDFQVQTKNPILWLSNELDAVTPLAAAKNMSAGFPGSRLLVTEGYGVSRLPSGKAFSNFHFDENRLPSGN